MEPLALMQVDCGCSQNGLESRGVSEGTCLHFYVTWRNEIPRVDNSLLQFTMGDGGEERKVTGKSYIVESLKEGGVWRARSRMGDDCHTPYTCEVDQ
jgi:hypothetical protein